MYCEEAQRKLNAYLDGELTGEARARLQGHLESCPQCSEELQRHQRLNRLLEALPAASVSEGFAHMVREQAVRRLEERVLVPAEWRASRRLLRVAAMLALVAGVLLGGFMSSSVAHVQADQITAAALDAGNGSLADLVNAPSSVPIPDDYLKSSSEAQ